MWLHIAVLLDILTAKPLLHDQNYLWAQRRSYLRRVDGMDDDWSTVMIDMTKAADQAMVVDSRARACTDAARVHENLQSSGNA